MIEETSALLRRLAAFTRLSTEEKKALTGLIRKIIQVEARSDLIAEGERPTFVNLVLSGWACRYKTTPDGRRQIVSFFIPGDFCDANVFILRSMDHSIGAITPLRVARIVPGDIDSLTNRYPRITQALWWQELVNASVQREWTMNIGARSAYQRLAHLFIETFHRLRVVGLVSDNSFAFPPTQLDIADATGLTAVHVNRTLQDLRRDGLITLDHKKLTIPCLRRLADAAMFNPNYLHLEREGAHLDAND